VQARNRSKCFQMVQIMESDSHERVKMLVLLCAEEDDATRKAAAGGLAMLTSKSEKISKKIRDSVSALNFDTRCYYRKVKALLPRTKR